MVSTLANKTFDQKICKVKEIQPDALDTYAHLQSTSSTLYVYVGVPVPSFCFQLQCTNHFGLAHFLVSSKQHLVLSGDMLFPLQNEQLKV